MDYVPLLEDEVYFLLLKDYQCLTSSFSGPNSHTYSFSGLYRNSRGLPKSRRIRVIRPGTRDFNKRFHRPPFLYVTFLKSQTIRPQVSKRDGE